LINFLSFVFHTISQHSLAIGLEKFFSHRKQPDRFLVPQSVAFFAQCRNLEVVSDSFRGFEYFEVIETPPGIVGNGISSTIYRKYNGTRLVQFVKVVFELNKNY